jgi:hypothetical protein
MPDPLAHVYDLALRALAEQERQVAALHNRLAPVLAAGGLGATLLAPAAFRGSHTAPVRIACIAVSLLGIAVAIGAGVRVLVTPQLAFGVDSASANSILREHPAIDERGFYVSVTALLEKRRLENLPVLEDLHAAFTLMVCGMLVGVCGLALAAAVA